MARERKELVEVCGIDFTTMDPVQEKENTVTTLAKLSTQENTLCFKVLNICRAQTGQMCLNLIPADFPVCVAQTVPAVISILTDSSTNYSK